MKNYRIFVGILALALVFGLFACEGPVGPAGVPGTPATPGGGPGALVYSGTIDANDLSELFAENNAVRLVSGSTNVVGTVPAGKTLQVAGAVAVGSSSTDALAVEGKLEILETGALTADGSTKGAVTLVSGGTLAIKGSFTPDASFFSGTSLPAGVSFSGGAVSGAYSATQADAFFGQGVPKVVTTTVNAVQAIAALGTHFTAGKTLILLASNTLAGALDLSGKAGSLIVNGGGIIVAAGNDVTGPIALTDGGTISVTTAALAGKIDARDGKLAYSGTAGANTATFVGNTIGTIVHATGTSAAALPATVTSIGTVSIAHASVLTLTGTGVTSIGTVAHTVGAGTANLPASVIRIDAVTLGHASGVYADRYRHRVNRHFNGL
jgi:hypothetical protein